MESHPQFVNQESHTAIREVNLLSQVSIHFDKEEVRFLYFNLNCNYLKCNELLANIPSQKIKSLIEDLESRSIEKSAFVDKCNKLLEEKFKEDEKLKKRVKIELDHNSWNITKSTSPIFNRLSITDLFHILQYLDVYSLYAMSLTEKFFYKLEKSPFLYKHLCAAAFKALPQADDSIYLGMKDAVRRIPALTMNEYQKVLILSDVRKHVWGRDPKTIKSSKKYFSAVPQNNFRQIFFSFPRLRFDGYYYCCETYFRKGVADLTGFYVPIHYVKSYRYLRFMDNGRVIYYISTKKFTDDQAAKNLTIEAYEKNLEKRENKATIMIGEYILANSQLSIKMPDKTWVNEMEHILQVADEPGYTFLKIVSHQMRDIETRSVHQMERDMKDKERYYYFKRNTSFIKEIQNPELRALYDFRSADEGSVMTMD